MPTNQPSSLSNPAMLKILALASIKPNVTPTENNMSTIPKCSIEALEQAVEQYPSLAAICNDLQNLQSLRDVNTQLAKSYTDLTAECANHELEIVALKATIGKMQGLTLEIFALLAIGYFYPAILLEIVGGVLLFYCGGAIAVTAPKIAKAYNNLLKKLENLLER